MPLREQLFAVAYDRFLAPAEHGWLGRAREHVAGEAKGSVLEIGAGTGANLVHYRNAERVVLAEPSAPMRHRLDVKVAAAPVPVTVVAAEAADVPYPDGFFDTVVSTLVLCTVPDLPAALAEIHRVLRPGGTFRFLEHVHASGRLGEWQERVQPLWGYFAVGCHLDRDIERAIRGEFEVDEFEEFEPPEPLAKPMIMGVAR